MQQVIIDTETTNFMPFDEDGNVVGQVLSIGACILDTSKPFDRETAPTFHCYIDNGLIVGDIGAISMNQEIIKVINETKTFDGEISDLFTQGMPENLVLTPERAIIAFLVWLGCHDVDPMMTAGGKNFSGFDLPFLKSIPAWSKLVRIRHRVADPATLWFNPLTDETLPDLQTCMERAGVSGKVTHRADEDALDTAAVLSAGYQRLVNS